MSKYRVAIPKGPIDAYGLPKYGFRFEWVNKLKPEHGKHIMKNLNQVDCTGEPVYEYKLNTEFWREA